MFLQINSCILYAHSTHQLKSHLYTFINYQTEDVVGISFCGLRWRWRHSPICPDSLHTLIRALNSHSQLNFVRKSTAAAVYITWLQYSRLASLRKAVLKLRLKMEVEEGRLHSGILSGWKMGMGKTSEGAYWAKGQEAAWVLQGVGCRVEGGQQWVAVMVITANYTYWQGQKSAYFVKRSACWFIKEAGSLLDVCWNLVLVKHYVLTLKAIFLGASFHMEWYGWRFLLQVDICNKAVAA